MSIQHFYTQTVADGTATSVVRPSDWNSNHNMVYNLSGNTLGSSQLFGADVTFIGGNNITLSADTALDHLYFIGPAANAPVTLSFMEPTPLVGTANSSLGQNSLYFVPIKPQNNISMTAVNMLVSLSNVTSSIQHSVALTMSYGLYSLGTGGSTSQLLQMGTSSMAIIASYSSNTGRYTISQGTNSTTYSSAGTGSTSAWTGQRILAFPMATLLPEGQEYYFALAQSTASSGGTGALRLSHVVLNNMTNGSFGRLAPNGNTVSNISIIPNFNGFVYSTTSAAWPTTIGLSQRNIQSNLRLYIQLDA